MADKAADITEEAQETGTGATSGSTSHISHADSAASGHVSNAGTTANVKYVKYSAADDVSQADATTDSDGGAGVDLQWNRIAR